jgi:hypothetical protein
VPVPGPGNIFLRKSDDGVHFRDANDGRPVWNHRNVDVKFDRMSNLAQRARRRSIEVKLLARWAASGFSAERARFATATVP